MSNNFSTFDNPYATMAQGAYPRSPIQFPFDYLDSNQQQKLNSSQSIPFDFSKSVEVGRKTYPGGRHYSDNPFATDHPDWSKNGVFAVRFQESEVRPLSGRWDHQASLLRSAGKRSNSESQMAYFFMFKSPFYGIMKL